MALPLAHIIIMVSILLISFFIFLIGRFVLARFLKKIPSNTITISFFLIVFFTKLLLNTHNVREPAALGESFGMATFLTIFIIIPLLLGIKSYEREIMKKYQRLELVHKVMNRFIF